MGKSAKKRLVRTIKKANLDKKIKSEKKLFRIATVIFCIWLANYFIPPIVTHIQVGKLVKVCEDFIDVNPERIEYKEEPDISYRSTYSYEYEFSGRVPIGMTRFYEPELSVTAYKCTDTSNAKGMFDEMVLLIKDCFTIVPEYCYKSDDLQIYISHKSFECLEIYSYKSSNLFGIFLPPFVSTKDTIRNEE